MWFWVLTVSIAMLTRACDIFCDGEILSVIQLSRIYTDSKTFVDMPMKFDPEQIKKAFRNLPNHENSTLRTFLDQNFEKAGSDLIQWTPLDWSPNPPFLSKIQNPTYRKFASDINEMWKMLGRQLHSDVYAHPSRHSILPVPEPFIVPGGRFREFYYWDSYWVIRGLLICGMKQTAKQMITNALYLVREHGIVTNGARVYYLNRSQPPLLSQMVLDYYEATNDPSILVEAVPLLKKEYEFWMTQRAVEINVGGTIHVLNAYKAHTDAPRPESYVEDMETAEGLNASSKVRLWSHIIGAAESGWDFSSRWFRSDSLNSITTNSIIPVDLNSILYSMETNMQQILMQLGDPIEAAQFKIAADARKRAIQAVLWCPQHNMWVDYNYHTQIPNMNVYPSNFYPLWSGAYDEFNTTLKQNVVKSLIDSKLIQSGGVLTSTNPTNQQWDSPNAWAPLQWFIIKGLQRTVLPEARDLAAKMTLAWINSNRLGWNKHHNMMEKYNAFKPGEAGGGGEYAPEVGFGWTNGVALDMIQDYWGR